MAVKKQTIALSVAVVLVAFLGLTLSKTVFSQDLKPCQNFDLLSPQARQSAVKLAKMYPVHADPSNGISDPAPARTFFGSRDCNVMFAAVDRVKPKDAKPAPAGYMYWGGFEEWDGLSHGPDQIVAKGGDTLRKLANWDGKAASSVCVFDPKSSKLITPGPDDPLAEGIVVAFC